MVHFTVGDGPEEPAKSYSKDKTGIVRSYSQDTNMLLAIDDKTTSAFLSKTSYSENSLDSPVPERPAQQKTGQPAVTATSTTTAVTTTSSSLKKSTKELPAMSVDEETLSTDSNSTTDNDELKRRRRKFPQFPPFRKNKAKVT